MNSANHELSAIGSSTGHTALDNIEDDADAKHLAPTVVISEDNGAFEESSNGIQRNLLVRHIQLIAISGAIGAGVFISIGSPLTSGGPLALIIGVSIWCSVIWAISNCLVEICTLLPVPGGYLYYSGRFLDPAVRFASGYNWVLGAISFVCFELTAMVTVVQYWAPDLSPAVMISVGLIGLVCANGISARVYGEIEFWISILKVILMLGLFLFTFITMVGGNPLHDRYGFRYWKSPGVFASATAVGRLKGIWSGVTWGAFAVAGPDFLSIVAGETKHPRRVLPGAFRSTIFRVVFFYIGSALAITINCPYDSPDLLNAIDAGAPGAASSPYIINMNRLQIPGLPSLVNAVILTSIFSTASSFMFSATRVLHMLACEGQAPPFMKRTNRFGVPYVCVAIVAAISCLAYLSLSNSADIVLVWFTNLTTACTLLVWVMVGFTWLRFRAGLKAQNKEHLLHTRGYLQPFSGYYATFMSIFTLIFSGSYLMPPGSFDVTDFLFSYLAVFIYIFNWGLWKTKMILAGDRKLVVSLQDMDFVSRMDEMDRLAAADDQEIAEKPYPTTIGGKLDRWLF